MTQDPSKWYITQQTFPQLLHRNVTTFPNRTAQLWRSQPGSPEINTLTYAELGARISDMSAGLMALGIQKGDRVAIMGSTSPQWMQADYATLCAGAITVCVYPSLTENELAFLLKDSGSSAIFAEDDATVRAIMKIRRDAPELKHIIRLQEGTSCEPEGSDQESLTLDALCDAGQNFAAEHPSSWPQRWKSVTLDDPMTIVYTSGTTGNPKGAVHTHGSINAACRRDLQAIPVLSEEDTLLSFLPLAHTYERECGHGTAMHAALPIAYASPQTLLEDLALFRPTYFMSVPRIYERIYTGMKASASQSPLKKRLFQAAMRTGLGVVNASATPSGFVDMSEGSDLLKGAAPSLKLKYRLFDKLIFSKVRKKLGGRFRFAFSAAGSLPADLCKTFMAMGIRVFEGYGSTETCNTVNLNMPEAILPGSVGAPCSGVTGRIAEDGEWQVKGDNLFVGYWNNKEATREAFTEDGFYKTGDIVETVSENHIRIVDRKKGLLVLDTGKNVPSAKIEGLFSLSPVIDTVVAFGSGQKYVSALVIPNFDAIFPHLEEMGFAIESSDITSDGVTCIAVKDEIINHPETRRLIEMEMQKANTLLEPHERVKSYHVASEKLTEAKGQLTPTLKVKRNVVWRDYEDELTRLYSQAS